MDYNQIYKNNNNVWGGQPNKLLQKIYVRLNAGSNFLDLGCGQGRDSLFMLENGFAVHAVDTSQEGLNKIKELIQINNLPLANINLFCGDIKNYHITENKYDVINAFNSLQFLPKKDALKAIDNIKQTIKNKGFIIISSFITDKSFYRKTENEKRCFFEPLELKNIFCDFNIILYEEEKIKDPGHPGSPAPHEHNVVKIIAQKS